MNLTASEYRAMTVDLPWPARVLHPNARPHWAVKARATSAARMAAYLLAKGKMGSLEAGEVKVTCIFSPPAVRRNRDLDGLMSSCKAYFDGIADAIGVNDSNFRHQAPVWGIPRQGGNVRIVLEAA